ncbi:MAG TPA: FtsX-like permease family protein [Candidatus Krumholzibacteria bacterium]|nr:FtsX-like permease family protein [Candidatus Krumholzibacteria bacterium]
MNLYLSIVWRNLWRNKRRSLIAMSSVVFAVVVALATRSMQLGFYARTIDNVVSFYTGYVQIHDRGFEDTQSLDHSFTHADSIAALVEKTPHVTFAAPRLESFALLSNGNVTDGVQVVGIDPEREDRLTGLRAKITSGRYLEDDDTGMLLGSELAAHLGVSVGDTVVALGAGYHAATAADRFVVAGTVTYPTPELNATMAYLALPAAQRFYAAPGRVTSLAVMLDDHRALEHAQAALSGALGPRYEVITWKTMMPEMVQYIQFDNASGVVMLLLVYVVIGFGILGTVLMMAMERTREFGVLVAVGMKKSMLGVIVLLESVVLAVLGALAGIAAGIPLLVYLAAHPIPLHGEAARAIASYGFEPVLPFSLEPSIFVWQTITMLLIAMAAAVVPLHRIYVLDAVTAMRRGH